MDTPRNPAGAAVVGLFALFLSSLTSADATPSSAETSTRAARVEEAVVRMYCYAAQWGGSDLAQGVPLPMEIALERNEVFAWIETPYDRNSERQWTLLSGRFEGKEIFVSHDTTWYMGPHQPESALVNDYYVREARRHFENLGVIDATLVIPSDCTAIIENQAARNRLLGDAGLAGLYDRLREIDARGMRAELRNLGVWSEIFQQDARLTTSRVSYGEASQPGAIVILSVTEEFEVDWQYLAFRRERDGWRFLGNIDVGVQRYTKPEFELRRLADSGVWLAVRYMVGGGTGVVDYSEAWYDLSGDWRLKVLEFPASGHFSGWGGSFEYTYQATAPTLSVADGRYVVDVAVDVSYGGAPVDDPDSENDTALFDKLLTIRYVATPATKIFIADPEHSTQPLPEFGRCFTFAVDFIDYFYEELTNMARHGSAKQKSWLRDYLDACGDGPRKAILDAILDNETDSDDPEPGTRPLYGEPRVLSASRGQEQVRRVGGVVVDGDLGK